MPEIFKPRYVGTHDGSFHADEVTACALLSLYGLIDKGAVIRTRDSAVLDSCEYVCDVGGVYAPDLKRFDHHQADYSGTLSSAGMVLKYLLTIGKISQEEYDFLNQSIIMGVDAHDNGVDLPVKGVCTYSHLISNFAPIEHQPEKAVQDAAFMDAMAFAIRHLDRLMERRNYILSFQSIVQTAMDANSNVLLFDQPIPWMDAFFALGGEEHSALFVIMPSGSHWKLRGIPPNAKDKMQVRLSLPSKWAGLSNGDLKKASGISGALFCHKGRFFSLWETKEDALKALDYCLKEKR